MPRKGRKHPEAFTLMVVPHSYQASFSVRIPFWTIYVAAGLCVAAVASVAFLLQDYRDTTAQLAELRRGGQIDIVQQANLRNSIAWEQRQQVSLRSVIADQQASAMQAIYERYDDATRFNEEVAHLSAQIAELEQFKADIRQMVGLAQPTPAEPVAQAKAAPPAAPAAKVATAPAPAPAQSAPAPAAAPQAPAAAAAKPPSAGTAQPAPVAAAVAPTSTAGDDRVAASVSSRGETSGPSTQAAIAGTQALLDSAVPQQKAELQDLKQAVNDRVAKVDGKWSSPEQLKAQLSSYDASPRAWPVSGSIGDRFGYYASRINIGAQPYHKGIDILNAVGTPVRAPADGVVISAGWNGTYGLELLIQHGYGFSTLYAHLSKITVQAGESVKKGQVVANIGMTGLTTAPHLHYEIHVNGTPVDPALYLGR